ncbi:hypothetical protein BZA77DRAFT_311088 [Pyronema omphalodes]|nr:hypothetical protein BZA77DRAFT_311088 [Pyronema omphalodes]
MRRYFTPSRMTRISLFDDYLVSPRRPEVRIVDIAEATTTSNGPTGELGNTAAAPAQQQYNENIMSQLPELLETAIDIPSGAPVCDNSIQKTSDDFEPAIDQTEIIPIGPASGRTGMEAAGVLSRQEEHWLDDHTGPNTITPSFPVGTYANTAASDDLGTDGTTLYIEMDDHVNPETSECIDTEWPWTPANSRSVTPVNSEPSLSEYSRPLDIPTQPQYSGRNTVTETPMAVTWADLDDQTHLPDEASSSTSFTPSSAIPDLARQSPIEPHSPSPRPIPVDRSGWERSIRMLQEMAQAFEMTQKHLEAHGQSLREQYEARLKEVEQIRRAHEGQDRLFDALRAVGHLDSLERRMLLWYLRMIEGKMDNSSSSTDEQEHSSDASSPSGDTFLAALLAVQPLDSAGRTRVIRTLQALERPSNGKNGSHGDAANADETRNFGDGECVMEEVILGELSSLQSLSQ